MEYSKELPNRVKTKPGTGLVGIHINCYLVACLEMLVESVATVIFTQFISRGTLTCLVTTLMRKDAE